jgi:hypothetical protein
MPTLTGRVNTGVPDATSCSPVGYRNSAVLVTLRAVFAHAVRARDKSTTDTKRQNVLHLDALCMVPPVLCEETKLQLKRMQGSAKWSNIATIPMEVK